MFTDVKVVIGAVVAILIAIAVFIFIHRGHEVKQLQQQAVVQQFTNGNLQNTIEMDNQAAAISENTQVEATHAADNVVATQNAIQHDEQVKEANIHRQYATQAAEDTAPVKEQTASAKLPAPARHKVMVEEARSVHTDEANAVSAVRIGSLWQSWCQATGDSTQPQCRAQ